MHSPNASFVPISGAHILIPEAPIEHRNITVKTIVFCGINIPPLRSLKVDVPAKTLPYAAGNTISIYLITQWGHFGWDVLVGWIEGGQVWCLLEWSFADADFSSLTFTTRHALVNEETGGVGFGGGLDWAVGLLDHLGPAFQGSFGPVQLPQRLELPNFGDERLAHAEPSCRGPCSGSDGPATQRSWSGGSCQIPVSPPPDPLLDTLVFHPPQPIVYGPTPTLYHSPTPQWPPPIASLLSAQPYLLVQDPKQPEGHGCDDDDDISRLDSPGPLTHGLTSANSTRLPTPHQEPAASCGEEWTDQDVQNQIHIEILRRQRLEAQALYARTGDPSGLLAVSRAAAAAGEGVWQPSGLPYF